MKFPLRMPYHVPLRNILARIILHNELVTLSSHLCSIRLFTTFESCSCF